MRGVVASPMGNTPRVTRGAAPLTPRPENVQTFSATALGCHGGPQARSGPPGVQFG